jgi:hypothetical protein
MKCYNCGGDGHLARECPSGTSYLKQNPDKGEIDLLTVTPSVSNADGTDIWLGTVKTPERRAEPSREAIDATVSPEAKVELVAIIARIMVTWPETAKQVCLSIIQKGKRAATYATNPVILLVTAPNRRNRSNRRELNVGRRSRLSALSATRWVTWLETVKVHIVLS